MCLNWLWGTYISYLPPNTWSIFTERLKTLGLNIPPKHPFKSRRANCRYRILSERAIGCVGWALHKINHFHFCTFYLKLSLSSFQWLSLRNNDFNKVYFFSFPVHFFCSRQWTVIRFPADERFVFLEKVEVWRGGPKEELQTEGTVSDRARGDSLQRETEDTVSDRQN